MLSYPSGMHPRGLWYLFLRGPGFNSQSAQLSTDIPCDMAVTSAPQAMPPQHLWDVKNKEVNISELHSMECEPLGQFSNQCFSIM